MYYIMLRWQSIIMAVNINGRCNAVLYLEINMHLCDFMYVQVQPVHFTVHAVITSSDMQFDQTKVDFGFCSIHESVRSTVRLTNLSMLPQEFGFLGVPEVLHDCCQCVKCYISGSNSW